MPIPRPALTSASLILCALFAPACARYTTPGGAANLYRAIGMEGDAGGPVVEYDIAKELDRQPAARFPATLALLRIQDPGYRAYQTRAVNRGKYSIVTVRDVEEEEDLRRLHEMPMVNAVVPLNTMVVGRLESERDLRAAAARVHADALVLYTFDTRFSTNTTIPALGVITLGLFPNEQAMVTSTASAAIIDVRTGYVYALAESTHDTKQLANAWTSRDAVDQSRRRAERRAFEGLITELEGAWDGVVIAHARPNLRPRHTPTHPASDDRTRPHPRPRPEGGAWLLERPGR